MLTALLGLLGYAVAMAVAVVVLRATFTVRNLAGTLLSFTMSVVLAFGIPVPFAITTAAGWSPGPVAGALTAVGVVAVVIGCQWLLDLTGLTTGLRRLLDPRL